MVWKRLNHHEIKVVFAHRRPPGGCAARRVRHRRRHARVECASPWYDGTLDDIWPDDIWPDDREPPGHDAARD